MRRALMIMVLALAAVLGASGGAQALVMSGGASGHVGVATLPGTSIPTVSGSCQDPWLSTDLGGPILPDGSLCFHAGGSVLHGTETFAITWDPKRYDWATTRDYLEQFLKNVANGSHTLTSPYAVAPQYKDGGTANDRAANNHLYGGGCIDYGQVGESTCRFPNAVLPAAGRDYPNAKNCPPPGTTNVSYDPAADPVQGTIPNCYLLTDANVQHELASMVSDMGFIHRTQSGYTPLLALTMPPGVEVCIDGTKSECGANSDAPAKFCSYHSYLTVGSTKIAYVVQPWTAYTTCDPVNVPSLSTTPSAEQLATDAGLRMVSALSRSQIAAVSDPWLNGWFTLNNAEIDDRCPTADVNVDTDKVGAAAYPLAREFSNAGMIESDPNAPACAPSVDLAPTFVAPSPIDPGDVVAFDGSVTDSTLMVPQAGYKWNFGDGTPAQYGASLVHIFAKAGVYTVTLTVTDRGGNQASFSQRVTAGKPNSGPPAPPPHGGSKRLKARLRLMPQGLTSVVRSGIAVRVSSNEAADGLVTLSISRHAASQAHIKHGRGATVVIGRGSVRGIKNGTVKLHLRLPRSVASKLRHLKHVAVSVRLMLFASGGDRIALDAAGRY